MPTTWSRYRSAFALSLFFPWFPGVSSVPPENQSPAVVEEAGVAGEPQTTSPAPEEPLVLPGVVIEEIPKDSALEKAGLQVGDVILSWERLPHPPANPEGASGRINSSFDWMGLTIEQPSRGRVILSYARNGHEASAEVPEGSWGATVTPLFLGVAATVIPALKARLKSGKGEMAFADLKESLESLRKNLPPAVLSFQFFDSGDLYARFSRWESADAAYRQALVDLHDGLFQGMVFSSLASLYRSRNMMGEAMALSDQAVERYRMAGASVFLARELQRLSKLYVATNAYPKAVAALDEAIEVLTGSCPGSLSQAAVLNSRGVLRRELRDLAGARSDHEAVLEISGRLAPCGDHQASALLSLGNLWYIQDNLERAEKLYRQALAIREVISPEELSMASVLSCLANIHERRGENEEALLLNERALRIRRRLAPDGSAVADSLNSIGLVYKNSGNVWAAEGFIEESLRIRSKLDPGSLAEAEAFSNLGLIASDKEEFDRAISLLSRALNILKPLPQGRSFFAGVLVNLGTVYIHQGNLTTAERYFSESLARLKEVAASDSELGVVMLNLGNVSYARAEYEVAGERYREAARLFLGLGKNTREASVCFANLASVAQRMHRIEEAMALYKESMAIEELIAPHGPEMARILANMGLISLEEGRFLEAKQLVSRALGIERENQQNLGAARALTNLGEIAMKGRNYDKALNYYSESLRLLNENGPELQGRAEVLFNIGWLYKEVGDLDRARSYFLEAESAGKGWAQDTWFEAELDHALGSIAERLGDNKRAQELFIKAVRAIERQVVISDPQPSDRLWFREKYRDFYESLMENLLLTGNLQDSFAVSERGRGRSFLEALSMRKLDIEGLISPASEQRDLGTIEAKKMQITEELTEARDHAPGESRRKIEELLRLRQEYGDALKDLGESKPGGALVFSSEIFDVRATIESLDPATVLLSYWVSSKQTYLFVLTRNGEPRVHIVPIDQGALGERIWRLRNLTNAVDSGAAARDFRRREILRRGSELYQLLVQPAEDQIEKAERVLIVSDGPLHYLPFGALVRKVADGSIPPRDQYLAEWKPLHSILSATLYAEIQKGRQSASGTGGPTALSLVAFGDPRFPVDVSEKKPDSVSDLRVRSAVRRGMVSFQALPFSRREVEGIAALFPPEKVKVFVGADATEEQVKAVGKGARILHFATHARLDDLLPLDSALVLTIPQGLPSDRDNGLLQVWEIFEKVRLDADLVVLSGCETALGEEQGGEGLIGLTRAFQYAGARTVMASLWSVQDRATSELMIRFYKHLRSGLPKDEALRQAQIELIRGPIEVVDEKGEKTLVDASAPYYWAGFQVYGDWQ